MSTFEKALALFFAYSFIGYLCAMLIDKIIKKPLDKHKILTGPIYAYCGFISIALYILLYDLRNNTHALFFGACIYGTILEYSCALFQRRFTGGCIWDYSRRKFNILGFICPSSCLMWGVIGFVLQRYITPFLLKLLSKLAPTLPRIILIILTALFIIDVIVSFIRLHKEASKETHYRRTTSRTILILCIIFLVGSFVGSITEKLFFFIRWGVLYSRATLLFCDMNLTWGFISALLTWLVERSTKKNILFYFIAGTILGAAFEYAFSVITGLLFGIEFWNYSSPLRPESFALMGRISLPICCVWGIGATIWLNNIYPFLEKNIKKMPLRPAWIIVGSIMGLVVLDLFFTSAALSAWENRETGDIETSFHQAWFDSYVDDEAMENEFTSAWIVPRGLYMFEEEPENRYILPTQEDM